MFGAVLAGVMNRRVSFDGTFTTTSGSSPVTSSTRTCAHAGMVEFDTITSDGSTPQYSKNGGAYANITEGLTVSFAIGDTLAVRATLTIVAQTSTFNLRSGTTTSSPSIEAVVLTRS